MMRPYVTYVPDELWRLLGNEIHHFEYGKETSVAVYADGRREDFDSKVTEEMIKAKRDADRDAVTYEGRMVLRSVLIGVVDRRRFAGVVTGWTS